MIALKPNILLVFGFLFSIIIFLVIKRLVDMRKTPKKIANKRTDVVEASAENFLANKKMVEDKQTQLNERIHEIEESKRAMLNILEDVEQERKINLEQKNRLQVIIDNLPVGIFIAKAPRGEPEMINVLGVELLGKGLDPGANKDTYQSAYQIVRSDGTPYPLEDLPASITLKTAQSSTKDDVFIKHKDGLINISATSTPIKDASGDMKSVVVVFRDKTKEYEVDRAKTEFVSLASHQLRTPLTAINWYAEMLLAGDAGKLSSDQENFVNQMYVSSKRMAELVNALLNVSRIDLGTFTVEPKPTNVLEIADEVLKDVDIKVKQKSMQIIRDYDLTIPSLNMDPKLARMIFQNLITNAIKYTPEKGEIRIKIILDSNDLMITVKDTGYGIPDRQKDKIFTKLFRADNVRDKESDGTGLGLYIVKSIVEALKGTIVFESELNKGTTFVVKLPKLGMQRKEGSVSLT